MTYQSVSTVVLSGDECDLQASSLGPGVGCSVFQVSIAGYKQPPPPPKKKKKKIKQTNKQIINSLSLLSVLTVFFVYIIDMCM